MSTNFPAVQNAGDLQSLLTKDVKVQTTDTGAFQHVKYGSYTGDWLCGAEKEDITDCDVVINIVSIVHGWHLWVDGKVLKYMAPFNAELPQEPDPVKDSKNVIQQASQARGFQGMVADGTPTAIQWETGTDGCRRSIDAILNLTMARAATEAVFLYPKVKLTSGTPYENAHKKGEMIHPPVLELLAWCDQDGNEEGGKAAQVEDKTTAEEEAKPEAPKRQRRQRKTAD